MSDRHDGSAFFELRRPYSILDDLVEFVALIQDPENSGAVSDVEYGPNKLVGPTAPGKLRIENIAFCNVSFSGTHLSFLHFENCKFDDCLFVGAVVDNCSFVGCSFLNCNFSRCNIDKCYVDPRSFESCIDPHIYPEIGVSLYQELLHNSRQIAQPEFTREAQFQLMRWMRFEKRKEMREGEKGLLNLVSTAADISSSWLLEKIAGYGLRLGRFITASIAFVFLISLINYFFQHSLGLMLNSKPVDTFVEALYFSVIVITSLGFGDITPTTQIGQVVVSLEAVSGFFMFAVLASMLYRRIAG